MEMADDPFQTTLSDKTKAAMLTSPEAKLRGKMLETLDLCDNVDRTPCQLSVIKERSLRYATRL